MNEEWRDIKGYEGCYQVSNMGRIKSLKLHKDSGTNSAIFNHGKIRKQPKLNCGYLSITLSKNGFTKTKIVHNLVATAFIPNPFNKRTVNHINGIKTDNRVDNLEWATQKENIQHAWETGLSNTNYLKKKVLMLSLENEPIKIFNSLTEAGKKMNITYQSISLCCKRTRKTAGGYKWKYYKKEETK